MMKTDIKFYPDSLIEADVEFVLYQTAKRGVNLIPGTGIQKLIDECRSYIALSPEAEIYNATIKPLLVLYSLSNTLRILWMRRKEFAVQLTAMNTGTFEYGIITAGENNFKDFEFELFSAAHLNEFGVEAELPQHTAGNDIFYKDIEIQCKHPEVFNRDKIDDFLRTFQISLQSSQKYGVFGLGLDDYLAFNDAGFPADPSEYEKAYHKALREQEGIMRTIFDDTLRYCPRVLGIYIVNTFFGFNTQRGLFLNKTTNSVFCLRPKAKEVQEELHVQAYEILSVFNSKPSIRHY